VQFRWFWDYSGGQLTNFGTHYLDVIQWASARRAQERLLRRRALRHQDNREIPDTPKPSGSTTARS
jgi:hypothetical protein